MRCMECGQVRCLLTCLPRYHPSLPACLPRVHTYLNITNFLCINQVIEIVSLAEHLITECDAKAQYEACPRSGLAVRKSEMKAWKEGPYFKPKSTGGYGGRELAGSVLSMMEVLLTDRVVVCMYVCMHTHIQVMPQDVLYVILIFGQIQRKVSRGIISRSA